MNSFVLQTVYFDRFDVFEGIDVNKTSLSNECHNCHCWYFFSFELQPNVCNRCHDLLMISMNFIDIAV